MIRSPGSSWKASLDCRRLSPPPVASLNAFRWLQARDSQPSHPLCPHALPPVFLSAHPNLPPHSPMPTHSLSPLLTADGQNCSSSRQYLLLTWDTPKTPLLPANPQEALISSPDRFVTQLKAGLIDLEGSTRASCASNASSEGAAQTAAADLPPDIATPLMFNESLDFFTLTTYDAVWALAFALGSVINSNRNSSDAAGLAEDVIMAILRGKVPAFNGVSGFKSWGANGDPESADIVVSLTSFMRPGGSGPAEAVEVGQWTQATGLQLHSDTPIVWRDGSQYPDVSLRCCVAPPPSRLATVLLHTSAVSCRVGLSLASARHLRPFGICSGFALPFPSSMWLDVDCESCLATRTQRFWRRTNAIAAPVRADTRNNGVGVCLSQVPHDGSTSRAWLIPALTGVIVTITLLTVLILWFAWRNIQLRSRVHTLLGQVGSKLFSSA